MTFRELKRLVSKGENQYVEFKRKAANPLKIMKEVSALANTEGGRLIVGVDDNLSIPGLKYPGEELFVLENAIQKHCKPIVDYRISYVPVDDDRTVLILNILKNQMKPVYVLYNLKRKTGKAYLRVADRSIQASKEACKILKARSREKDFGFAFGDLERSVLRFVEHQGKVSIEAFVKHAQVTREEAADIFVRLATMNVLRFIPGEKSDFFAGVQDDPDIA